MKNDSAHLIGKLEGITAQDLEWSVTGTADYSDINMGHLGFEWQQSQYDLSFEANQPVGGKTPTFFPAFPPIHTDLQVEARPSPLFLAFSYRRPESLLFCCGHTDSRLRSALYFFQSF